MQALLSSQCSNTTLRNHITHPHCEVLKAQKNQNSEARQTSMARDGSVFRYDPDYLREQFAGLEIQRALPFNHFDHEKTTRLAAKQEIIDSFGNLDACVNLTTDVWSAPHGVPGSYLCVTEYWIEPDTWQMMKRVISFKEFSSPHTGRTLFKMLIKVLTNFNLEDKVMSITLDNASNNTSAMDKLKLKYDPPIWVRNFIGGLLPNISIGTSTDFLHEYDSEEDVFDDEGQRNEAIPLSDEEIALDANGSSEGTMSPGGPR
nr:hypothetical protein [Tanacetum cinerariifolium]